jgi:broad specificity phosphatase PhoE
MCGQTDVPLTLLGCTQAAALGRKRLRADAVYSSPLRRARQTAQPITDEIRCEPALGEIDCGRLDGAPFAAIQRDHAELWAANQAQHDDDFRWPDGESYRELRARSIQALKVIAALHAGQRVVLVTHAGVISQVIGHVMGTPPARWSLFRVGNASTTEIHWTGDRGTLRSFDVRDHLAPALRT